MSINGNGYDGYSMSNNARMAYEDCREMTCKIVADYIKKNSNEYADTYSSEDDFTCNSYDKDDVDYEY